MFDKCSLDVFVGDSMGMHWNLLAASLYTFLLQCSLEASNNNICGRDDDVDDGDDVDAEMTTVLMIIVFVRPPL